MRALLALLLLANLGFFALARGGLEPFVGLSTRHEREPQRLAAQVNAELVRVLDAASAASALSLHTAQCLQAGPFSATQIDAAEARLAQAQLPPGSWQRLRADTGSSDVRRPQGEATGESYWLRVDAADAAQRERLLRLAPNGAAMPFAPCP